ncbi:hypothetical protein E0765_07170 [Sulfuricurvum sp. IAE1]|uniref:hypothetical protein n=1 Tax=Sulfuricurvum sp. IAE1 TaxID=2546102 RepID=UPI001049BCD3|nr:hypothetical protein [Sulfuricurvum sp. IAE1]TDA63608.1 hypothetical protein E0765_07170 [Sulfuricurvum sp. IAE1]
MITSITEEQFNMLLGFKYHIWTYYHENDASFDAMRWAEMLDKAGINWFVQNTVAILMETRANGFSSLAGLLKAKGIEVRNDRCA